MQRLYSPQQVAHAIRASESSVKRWCDKGVISARLTPGGHRRILMSALIQFLRQGSHELVHPEALGLPPTSGQSARVVERACQQMTESLVAGDELRCRQIAIDLYLAELNGRIKENPNDLQANEIVAKIYYSQGYYGKAANVYRKILTINPNNKEARSMLAKLEKR